MKVLLEWASFDYSSIGCFTINKFKKIQQYIDNFVVRTVIKLEHSIYLKLY